MKYQNKLVVLSFLSLIFSISKAAKLSFLNLDMKDKKDYENIEYEILNIGQVKYGKQITGYLELADP